jgi:hypothetical protein
MLEPLDTRHRDKDGEIRKKQQYSRANHSQGVRRELRKMGYRADAKFGTVMKKEKAASIHDLLTHKR